MKMIKCDRCGKVFESKLRCDGLAVAERVGEGYEMNLFIDMCNACLEDFKEFMGFGEDNTENKVDIEEMQDKIEKYCNKRECSNCAIFNLMHNGNCYSDKDKELVKKRYEVIKNLESEVE